MSDPFDLVHSPESAAEAIEMQQALGLALNRWSRIESGLALIFQYAVTAHRSSAADAAFAAIRSTETQIDVVDATVKSRFSAEPDVIVEWERLKLKTHACRKIRNKLAHGPIVRTTTGRQKTKVRFVPFYYMHSSRDMTRFPSFTVKQIRHYAEQFAEAGSELNRFGHSISPFRRWREEFAPQQTEHRRSEGQKPSPKRPRQPPSKARTQAKPRAPRRSSQA